MPVTKSATNKSLKEFDRLINSKKKQIASSKNNKKALKTDLKNLQVGKEFFTAYTKSMK